MKKVVLVLLGLFVLFACEEEGSSDILEDASAQAVIPDCVRYVDGEMEENGDGLSWETAFNDLEEAIADAEAADEEGNCEVWAKDGTIEEADDVVVDASNVPIYKGFSGTESIRNRSDEDIASSINEADNTILVENDTGSNTKLLSSTTPAGADSSSSLANNRTSSVPNSATPLASTWSGRVDITNGGLSWEQRDASGSANTGLLEIDNTLRFDANEIITNTGTTLFLQYDNGGDLRVDGSTFFIDASTNRVGIGTTTPNYRLDVAGTIRTTALVVQSGWSDFVFEDDYDLMPLDKVEKYIEQNGHLPDIPPAKEVQANGVSIGESQARLLQKIEELTLHAIEQNKRLNQLSNEMKTTKAELNGLRATERSR